LFYSDQLVFLFFHHVLDAFHWVLTKSVGTGIEDDILIELFSVIDVRLIEGVMDLKAFRSIGTIEKRVSLGISGSIGGNLASA
jgi:hypothetical protein